MPAALVNHELPLSAAEDSGRNAGVNDRSGHHRIVDIIEGNGEQWNRAGNRYRDHVAGSKYAVVKIED